jgi:simple sugar transport system ATP-binding protein
LVLDELVNKRTSRTFSLRRAIRLASEVAGTLGFGYTTSQMRRDVRWLSVSEKQLVIVARALYRSPRLLILDEPTSSLSSAETDRLFEVLSQLSGSGVAVLYISHRLGEVEELAQRIGVLRNGRITATFVPPYEESEIVSAMLGTGLAEAGHASRPGAEDVLVLSEVQVLAGHSGIDLTVRSGQVTAIVGLMGSGKTELAETVFGARPLATGAMSLDGREYRPRHPQGAVRRGVYLVPEDRGAQALFPTWSVQSNFSLPFLQSLSPIIGLVRTKKERQQAARLIEMLNVVCTGPQAAIESLSGGNQQKVVVGRWLGGEPRLIVLDNPFVGIDVGARRDIALRLRESAEHAAVLVLTADPEEASEVADRVLVLAGGELVLDAPVAEISYKQIVAAMTRMVVS